MNETREFSQVIAEAPTLVARDVPPAILEPSVLADAYPAASRYRSLTEEGAKTLDTLQAAIARGAISYNAVSAKTILTTALTRPKELWDYQGFWYSDIVDGIVDRVTQLRFGYDAWNYHKNGSDIFQFYSESWQRATREAMFDNNLWEFGICISRPKGAFHLLSLSVPWDNTRQPWHQRISAPRMKLVGRGDLVDAITQAITGKTRHELDTEAAFSMDEDDLWWGQATFVNNINRTAKRAKGRPFAEAVVDAAIPQADTAHIRHVIKAAKWISGYKITAFESDFPGAIELQFAFDDLNWIPKPRREPTRDY